MARLNRLTVLTGMCSVATVGCGGGSSDGRTVAVSPSASPLTASPAPSASTLMPSASPSPTPTSIASKTPTPMPTATAGSAMSPYRLLIGEILMRAIAADPVAAPLLNGTHPIVILTGESPPYDTTVPDAPAAWGASYMLRFSSEADIEPALASGEFPPFVSWIMYDNEPATKPPTPPDELPPNDPGPFFAAAAMVAHANGRLFASTGGFSGTQRDTQDVYATSGSWDLHAIQNQTGEDDLTKYKQEITSEMALVWAVNPLVAFSSGVGDYASGTLALPPTIDAAMESIPANGLVWFNFGPHPGSLERNDLAIQVIEDTAGVPRAAPLVP